MASETVLDYLGHPCQIAKARDRFKDPLEQARADDPRAVVRRIGNLLNVLNDREEHIGNVIELAEKLLPNCTDDDEARAVLAVAHPYQIETCNYLYELAGQVLAALEHGKLVEVSHV